MRYNTKFDPVQTEGLGEIAEMGIELSGKAFRSLIDAIYSRKIEAPIRELSTNCLDSHTEAGIIQPFDIHLPTMMEPTFYVRDYGISMTDEFVRTRFKNLFDSTKDGAKSADVTAFDPNKTVGSWGLGSKSPFAYIDTLTLTCWLDAEIRIYSIFIGENGRPCVAGVHTGPTTESDGLKVEFAVKPSDIEEFEEAAIRVFKGFNLLPNGLPTQVLAEVQTEPRYTGSFFKTFDTNYLGAGFFARQGCVIYPIDLDRIDTDTTGFGNIGQSVVIDFPIGSIEYTNSREFLAYTEETVAALTARFIEFRDELSSQINTTFAGIKNRFQRAHMAGSNDLFSLKRFAFLADADKDRREIANVFDQFLPRNKKYEDGQADSAIDTSGERVRQTLYTFAGSGFPQQVGMIWLDETTKMGSRKTRGINDRVASWLSTNKLQYAYIFEKLPPLEVLRRAGFPPITRLSAIPVLPQPVRDPASYGGGFVRFKLGADEIAEDQIAADALFVLVNRGNWLDPSGTGLLRRSERDLIEQAGQILGRQIIQINTRSNEASERWGDHPKAYGLFDNMIDELTDEQVKAVVAKMNYRRFHQTDLHDVAYNLRGVDLLDGTVFETLKRFLHFNHDNKNSALLDVLSSVIDDPDNTKLHQIIERGRALGLEMLAPPFTTTHRVTRYRTGTYPLESHLTPKNTDRFIHLCMNNSFDKEDYAYLIKEISACR